MAKGWIKNIVDAAIEKGVDLPPFESNRMGCLKISTACGKRFIIFKRRLIPANMCKDNGIQWALWEVKDGEANPIVMFRDALAPSKDKINSSLVLICRWLNIKKD